MRAALSGDATAYRQLLEAVAPHVRGIARGVVGRSGRSHADVEDVVQDTLLAIHLKRSTWDPSKPFLPWLNAVARHKAIDSLRRRGGRMEVDLEDVQDDLAGPAVDQDRQLDVATALADLDPRQRTIVELMSLEGRTAAEVAATLDMSEGAVRVALHRALKALSAKFGTGAP